MADFALWASARPPSGQLGRGGLWGEWPGRSRPKYRAGPDHPRIQSWLTCWRYWRFSQPSAFVAEPARRV